MGEMEELLERVDKATGPDRELDLAIYETISGKRAVRTRFGSEEAGGTVVRAYTASLDASLALVERVLPDAVWSLSSGIRVGGADGYSGFGADVGEFIQTADYLESIARAPAVALLAALLRALIKEKTNG